ncbi:MAG TPA: formylmethanofuran dehydrogenase subunit C [Methylibium sp.]|uniref:formylmethanofuran dehydrogenase subunit C n=1 Tax=Methylibium sp. TaxID=2067992 RepID=UPI002DBBEDF7|nr:formylmethanofuran dehydrogenase subunit C [Methylibium sp.]HEU4459792.1 formylmethanofuran dehydrogenase subunit C [Methylibium sp.]
MSAWRLSLKQAPALRVDARGLSPAALAGLDAVAVGELALWHGNERVALGDLFAIEAHAEEGELRLEGELSKFDRIGWQLAAGSLRIDGPVGDYLGAGMSAGAIVANGDAGVLAACEMSGGRLDVAGSVGDFAASALPGSMDGMRGGTFIVRGHAGERFGDRMRRGSAIVFGDAGDFVASRMVAGTIAVAGAIGAHPGYGMRRGTLLAAGAQPTVPPCFVGNTVDIGVFWQLLARDLARHGGPFAALAKRAAPRRFVGDLAAGGKGELLIAG